MKLKYISTIVVGLTALASCTDNDYMQLDKGSTELELTTNATEVVLQEANHSSEALQLQWTTGTNYGTGNRISYTLEIAQAGTEFARPYTVKSNVQQDYEWKPSVESLNALLIDNLGVEAGRSITLDARVTAVVEGREGSQVAATSFAVTTYKAVTETLYLIGDATPNGWSADNASEMVRTDNGIFTWTGHLTPGDFKFITTKGQFLPSYNNDGNGKLVYRTSDDQPDEKFTITEDHFYRVDANLLTLEVTITPTEGVAPPAFDQLYFVGSVTGWSFWKMTVDPLDPYLFRIGVFFNSDSEFKFGTSEGSWENMYKATQYNAPYTDQSMVFIKGFDPDNKWFLTSDEANQAYKICVDIRSGAERMMMRQFTPYTEMYLVGDATPNGWDIGNATPMTVDPNDPNIFTWTGHLNAGELKFSADKKSDWMGAWFLAYKANKVPTGEVEKVLFIDKSDSSCSDQYLDIAVGDVDQKWKIETAGNYTITLNQLYEEVTIVKN